MKYMMIVKATKDSEAGVLPSAEMIDRMGKFNEELVKAGVLVDAAGLRSSAHGFKVRYAGGKKTVIDGPFTEAKELIAGFWIINVKSPQEARDWAQRVPNPYTDADGEIEIRKFFEMEDFEPSEAVERAKELGKKIGKK